MSSFLLAATVLAVQAAMAAPTVNISSGPVTGVAQGDLNIFRGIPYATQPVGALRWKSPQSVTPWTTPLDATKFGAACPQPEDHMYEQTQAVQSEACLFVNVWAPMNAKSLPVMVWIHGGSNRMGTGSLPMYDGTQLASRGVVVVTLNYRLGYLGFVAHDALEKSGGNFAFDDQIAALKWVQQNIVAFGGDPARVTVFGESAGGGDILYLMSNPAAAGLFSAAIVESGGGWHKPLSPEKARKQFLDDLKEAKVEATTADALRALPASTILKVQGARAGSVWLDGVTVTEPSWKTFEAGRAAPVPLIIGSNSYEANLMKLRGFGLLGKAVSFLPSVYEWYGDTAKNSAERQDLLFRDMVFEAPARWVAQVAKGPTYLYRYGHVMQSHKGRVPGAIHAAEIPYVFENLDTNPNVFGRPSAEDRKLAHALADCWVAFAKVHKPACDLADWKPYDKASDQVLWIDDDAKFEKHPDAAILDGVRAKFGPGAFWFGS